MSHAESEYKNQIQVPTPTQKLKWVFDFCFPGNRFEFDIILNDIKSSTFLDFQISPLFANFLEISETVLLEA